jgi:hypothetical protein
MLTMNQYVKQQCVFPCLCRYPNGILLEINAHSLFSKVRRAWVVLARLGAAACLGFVQWFSESGKLVMRLFQHIKELVDGEDALVCVLIGNATQLVVLACCCCWLC